MPQYSRVHTAKTHGQRSTSQEQKYAVWILQTGTPRLEVGLHADCASQHIHLKAVRSD
jgi:hypothetical protein